MKRLTRSRVISRSDASLGRPLAIQHRQLDVTGDGLGKIAAAGDRHAVAQRSECRHQQVIGQPADAGATGKAPHHEVVEIEPEPHQRIARQQHDDLLDPLRVRHGVGLCRVVEAPLAGRQHHLAAVLLEAAGALDLRHQLDGVAAVLADAVRRALHAMPARKDARQRHVAGLAKLETAFEQRIAEGVGLQRPDVTADELAPQAQPLARSDIGGGNDGQIVLQVPAPSLRLDTSDGPFGESTGGARFVAPHQPLHAAVRSGARTRQPAGARFSATGSAIESRPTT